MNFNKVEYDCIIDSLVQNYDCKMKWGRAVQVLHV